MRKGWLIVALVLVPVMAQAWTYLAFEQITVGATAIGLTAATINIGGGHPGATAAYCRLETAEIRYTIDGTTPTSTIGTLLEIGEGLSLTGNDALNNFRAIRTGGSSGKLNCNYSTP